MSSNFLTCLLIFWAVFCWTACDVASAQQPKAPGRPKLVMAHAMQWSMPGSSRFSRSPYLGDQPQSYYENAPLIFPANDDDNGALIQYFIDAKAGGIDAINMHIPNAPPMQIQKVMHRLLDAAKASKTDVKVYPLIAGIMKSDLFAQFLKIMWEDPYTREHPNFLRIDGKPVIITYGHRKAQQWQTAIANAKAVGGKFFLINDTSCLAIGVTEKVPEDRLRPGIDICDGLYYFASGTLGLPGHDKGPLANFMTFGHSFNPPKYTGASIRPGYIGMTRVGNLLSPRGTEIFRKQWLEAIANNPDFIHLTTMNDYSEATSQECSANSSFTYMDMNRYFSTRWKTGKWPALDKPQAFLSYRKAVAADEMIDFELVVLTPQPGKHHADAAMTLYHSNGSAITLKPVSSEQLPGHIVMHFQVPDGLTDAGFATPHITAVTVDDKPLALPDADAAAFAIQANGQSMQRKWLRVPLHRLAADVHVKLVVKGSPANLYPRSIFLQGVPWDQTAGYIIERDGNSLLTPTDAKPINPDFGYLEMFDEGAGYAPMRFTDVKYMRRIVDTTDRYTTVIRLKNDTIAYAKPVSMAAPHVDPSTVLDLLIQPRRGILHDRGMMGGDYNMQKQAPATRPQIARPRHGKPWIMRFDGKDDCLSFGPLNMPAGPATLEVWVNPQDSDKPTVICDQKGAALGLALMPDHTLKLMRVNIDRKAVWLNGTIKLSPKTWHHVVAVYDGCAINLYVDGKRDGQPVPCHGLRTDEGMYIGRGGSLPSMLAQLSRGDHAYYHGDIARFRILQRALSGSQIKAIYDQQKMDF